MKNPNSKKIILDLCGGTGAWSKPYKDAGYNVRVITLPEYDVTNTRIGWDFIFFCKSEKGNPNMEIKKSDVYGILAAPPCTMFSFARSNAKLPRDFVGAMEIVNACLSIVYACRTKGNLKFWALENPRGYLRQFLGRPPLTFTPSNYGDAYSKATDLWGYYNEPKKSPVRVKKNWEWENIKSRDGLTRTEVRAITPTGFVKAFFKANK